MIFAHDVFSEMNPAFGVYALVGFVTAFTTINEQGPETPVAYLSLPLALSGDLGATFEGTNINTGLLEWLERHPDIQVDLAERLNGSMDIVTKTIHLGCFTNVVEVEMSGHLRLGERSVNKSAAKRLSRNPAQTLKRAERLGSWFAIAGSTKTIFDTLGLTV